jgi:hypothetical protein
MGRNSLNALRMLMVVCLFWMPATDSFGAELIEPTRVLEGDIQQPGRLSVFSEPPGLGVTLDGKAIGQTPVNIDSISPGTYLLWVGNKETMIAIGPGENRRLSFFKDAFIEMPAEEKMSREALQAAEEKPVIMSGSEQPSENSRKLEPGYFPLNPGGRIY